MATRWYFPALLAAPVVVSYNGWDKTNQAVRRLTDVERQNTALTTLNAASSALSPEFVLMEQAVSHPLAAQTITGTVKGQIGGFVNSANLNATLALAIKVVSGDGLTVRGTLLATTASQNISTSPPKIVPGSSVFTNRKFRDALDNINIPLTSLSILAGDRLVIEFGFRDVSTSTSQQCNLKIGDDQSTDAPEDETSNLTTTYNPWLEFTHNFIFSGAAVINFTPVLPNFSHAIRPKKVIGY